MEINKNIGEVDVGITEYLNNDATTTINCVYKHRYSDFIVNEIDQSNTVLWHTPIGQNKGDVVLCEDVNIDTTKEEEKSEKKDEEEVKEVKTIEDVKYNNVIELDESAKAELKALIGEEESDRFMKYIEDLNDGAIEKITVFYFTHIEDKVKRTNLHNYVKKYLKKFETHTAEDNGEKKIALFMSHGLSKNKRKKMDFAVRNEKDEYPYTECILFKKNIDTSQAVGYLAKRMKKNNKNFSYAGNKDKRGVTCQRLSIFKCDIPRLMSMMAAKNWNTNIELSRFVKAKQQLKLGQLKGNRFSIALRFVDVGNDELINKNLMGIKENGFINYFGMQRFGAANIKTHDIGREVIKGNWKVVIEKILSQQFYNATQEDISIKKQILQKVFEENDINGAIKILPRNSYIEKSILLGMKKVSQNGYFNGYSSISRQMRMLYPHAYQSYVWNRVVSARIKKFGKQILIGDIVMVSDNDILENIEEEDDKEAEVEEVEEDDSSRFNVEFVDEDNISKYSIYDIVMPLIGNKIWLIFLYKP